MSTIKLSLETVKKEAKTIYYSSCSLWWTHSTEDLKEATEMGKKAAEKSHEMFLNDPTKTTEEKNRMKALFEGLKKHQAEHGHNIPLDPWGAPLYQVDADKWIIQAEKKPEHFKKYGLEAFMKTHHQNSKLGNEIVRFSKWDQLTEYLDAYYSVANRCKK